MDGTTMKNAAIIMAGTDVAEAMDDTAETTTVDA